MQTISTIRALLAERGLRPRHRLGQNFLHDQNQVRRLVKAADLHPGELVLEVGPGTGALTEALLESGVNVIACELDPDMADIVESRCGEVGPDRFVLVRGDCLDGKRSLNPRLVEALGDRTFRLVANLPYQAATPLIANLLAEYPACQGQFVTIQREVADRLVAHPSTRAYGTLSVMVQLLGTVDLIGIVPAACFWPQPEVTSAMVAIRPRDDAREAIGEIGAFESFVTRLFSARRKQLGTTLGREAPWPAGVDPHMRPEALTPQQMLALWKSLGSPAGHHFGFQR